MAEQFEVLNLTGKYIREIWNIGIFFDEDDNEGIMSVEVDEPIVLVFDDFQLEILFVDGGTVGIAKDTLTLKETSYQGVDCSRKIEKNLGVILNTPIVDVTIELTDECEFTGAHELELPVQDKYIEEIVFKFNSNYTLHISAFYDYMYICIKDADVKIPRLEL
ncbi:hypothetical protein [Phosphitispora sp. TUW77]|uniref:hypothetical protein n=1 Tax=Phosphitispora sp. TUW77 TaxID=3152361 RepID=UPI003AB7719B